MSFVGAAGFGSTGFRIREARADWVDQTRPPDDSVRLAFQNNPVVVVAQRAGTKYSQLSIAIASTPFPQDYWPYRR